MDRSDIWVNGRVTPYSADGAFVWCYSFSVRVVPSRRGRMQATQSESRAEGDKKVGGRGRMEVIGPTQIRCFCFLLVLSG